MNRMLHEIVGRLRVAPLGVAMPGLRLPARIRTIIEADPIARLSRLRGACVFAFCAAICAAFFAVTLVRAQGNAMDGWEKAAGRKMAFDVASVKQNRSGLPPSGDRVHTNIPLDESESYSPTGGLVSITNYPVSVLISFAYKLNLFEQVAVQGKLPNWARADRFDVEARGPTNATKDEIRLMMQSLLADRFKLVTHFETHDGPTYDLVLAKPGQTGPQLTPYSDAHPCVDPAHPSSSATNGVLSAPCGTLFARDTADGGIRVTESDVSIQKIANDLSIVPPANIDRPVTDHTGLSGNYDFSIDFPKGMSHAGVSVDQPEPSFEALLQEQLGLKLESAIGPIRSLIIDHIEEPTPN